jgi:NitT/TauT family transport system substrate-binding protein
MTKIFNRYGQVTRRVALGVFVGALAVANAPALRAQSLEKVSIRLDWLPGADHSALFLAKERGYYKDQGLDVEILAGQGSVTTL